jgi:shikimate dehydrogenase
MLEYNGVDAAGKTAVVLGSGGAARAVVSYLKNQQAGELYLATRSPEQVDKYFYQIAPQLQVISYAELEKLTGSLLVNCTPVGMYPAVEASPVNGKISAAFAASVDLIYNPAQTLFLRQAQKAGHQSVNGLFMLVAQAVAAQEIWQGESYGSELIEKIMSELEKCL